MDPISILLGTTITISAVGIASYLKDKYIEYNNQKKLTDIMTNLTPQMRKEMGEELLSHI